MTRREELFLRNLGSFLSGFDQLHTALFGLLDDRVFSTPASVYLGFHDGNGAAKLFKGCFGFLSFSGPKLRIFT